MASRPEITRNKPHRKSYRPDIPLRRMTTKSILAWASREMKKAEKAAARQASKSGGGQ